MFDILPLLVIERIQDYLFPFVIHYVEFRSLSHDFKWLIDQVINDTSTEESINFRLWVIFIHQGCNLVRQEKHLYRFYKLLCFNFFHTTMDDFETKKCESLSVLSLKGKYELRLSVNEFLVGDPLDFQVSKGKIVLSYSNFYIKFNYLLRSTKVCFQTLGYTSSFQQKIVLPHEFLYWFQHNNKTFAKSRTDNKKLMMIDENNNRSIINLPFDSSLANFNKFGVYPFIWKKTNVFFQNFNPLNKQSGECRFSKYTKWRYIGSNEIFDCFYRRDAIYAYSRENNSLGTYQFHFFTYNKKFLVLSDRILYSCLASEKIWMELFWRDFQWNATRM